jgi:dUTP pyrophosphatase
MKIRIYRKNKNIPLPVRKTPQSIGIDVFTSETIEFCPGKVVLVPTGLIIESPAGYYFRIHIRSGFSMKSGISLANDVGIIDEDYCGTDDEIKIAMIRHYNPDDPLGKKPLIVKEGTRVAQIIFEKNIFPAVEWDEQKNPDFAKKSRGGFGSTGSN